VGPVLGLRCRLVREQAQDVAARVPRPTATARSAVEGEPGPSARVRRRRPLPAAGGRHRFARCAGVSPGPRLGAPASLSLGRGTAPASLSLRRGTAPACACRALLPSPLAGERARTMGPVFGLRGRGRGEEEGAPGHFAAPCRHRAYSGVLRTEPRRPSP
jgi:hypothetical protein